MPTSDQRSKAAEHFRAKNAERSARYHSDNPEHRTARTLRKAGGGTFGKLPPKSFNRLAEGTSGYREEEAGK